MHLNFEGLVPIVAGVYGLLAALGVVRVSKYSEANERWRGKLGPTLKILSPIVILFGVAELFGFFR